MGTEEAYETTLNRIENVLGFDCLKVIHLNDSQNPLHSRVDRHANIGEGTMGILPFRQLLCDERLRHLPFILETPVADNGHRRDIETLLSLTSQAE